MNVFQVFKAFWPFRAGVGDDGKIRQPVALEAPDEPDVFFVDGDGNLLTHGFRRVTPIED